MKLNNIFLKSTPIRLLLIVWGMLLLCGCSKDAAKADNGTPSDNGGGGGGGGGGGEGGEGGTAGTSSNMNPPANGDGDADVDASDNATLVEKLLTLELKLTVPPAPPVPEGGATDASDGGSAPQPRPPTTLLITARDGTTPLVTDLWLYTLQGTDKTPLTAFTSTAARKSPRLMLPATINGQPSGLAPADDGRENGLMTNTTRGKLVQGAFVSTVDGTVTVTLPTPPTDPILVIAGIEDQRYAGAAVVRPDGTPGSVPDGTINLETHVRRSFERDVKLILSTQCLTCHNPQGILDADLYLVTGTRDDLVNDNFGLKEQIEDCQDATPNDPAAQAACVLAITKTEYLVEPGAPALSGIIQRARPDESASTSELGLPWYGSKGVRYNATYGDRRMPSTVQDPDTTKWTNQPTYFDTHPAEFQILYDWVAQGAPP